MRKDDAPDCRYSMDELAASAGRAWEAACRGQGAALLPHCDTLLEVSRLLFRLWHDDRKPLDGFTFEEVAARLYGLSQDDDAAFDNLLTPAQVAWQAAVRHLVNLIDADPDAAELDDLEKHENHWEEWARKKVPVTA